MRVGILGGGQLGQMLTLAGYPLGIHTTCFEATADVPASIVGPVQAGRLEDADDLRNWAADVDVVTYEFENFTADLVAPVTEDRPLRPGLRALAEAQDRLKEKQLFSRLNIPVAPFTSASNEEELRKAVWEIGLPAVVKTRRGGYDGKGQVVVHNESEISEAVKLTTSGGVTVEAFVKFTTEVSIIGVRGLGGEVATYPLVENQHHSGILRRSRTPVMVDPQVEQEATRYMAVLLEELDYVGVLALELFLVNDRLFANEMAPRVHNSGHWTIEGAETSQFENHMRAITGMPLGSTRGRGFSLMHNLIATLPDRDSVLAVPGSHLHLYGKEPRPGRKLGHVTVTAEDSRTLAERVARLDEVLRPS